MSLSGSSAVSSEPITTNSRRPLFDDDRTPPGLRNSIFNEDKLNSYHQSKNPFTEKGDSKGLTLNLLSSIAVPEIYNQIYRSIIKDNDGPIDREQAVKTLNDSGLNSEVQIIIEQIIWQGPQTTRLTRDEFNVLLALIGLAQDQKDITLEMVHDRRHCLPVPNLSGTPKPSTSTQKAEELTLKSNWQSINPESPNKKYSYDVMDADPWANFPVHQNHYPSNPEVNVIQEDMNNEYVRPLKNYGISNNPPFNNPVEILAQPNKKILAHTRAPGSVNSIGLKTNSVERIIHRKKSDEDSAGKHPPKISNHSFGDDGTGSTGAEETIVVALMPEKEGVFMFQHHCYNLISAQRGTKVLRRFSDFVWLLDYLQKRYPFRQIPLLPPKRIGVNGNHLAADRTFIEKRRRGLSRFINSLIRHPILSQELMVIRFLTQPTEFSSWRKKVGSSVQDEFSGRSLPPGLEDSLPETLDDLFARTRAGICKSTDIYISLCILIDRLAKRNEGFAVDQQRVSHSLRLLGDVCRDTYSKDTQNVPLLNDSLLTSAKHITNSQILMLDEARAWDLGILEDLKKERDCFVSMRDVFDRRDQYDKDNIPYLEQRIKKNLEKLDKLTDEKSSPLTTKETTKIMYEINKDRKSIISQQARRVFVKQCILDELSYFQQTQYHIFRWNRDWAQERVKYSELQVDNWKQLNEDLESVSIG